MLTNNTGLPPLLVKALEYDSYDRGKSDYTVTQLISPPKIYHLRKTNEVTEDAADKIWMALGSAVHTFIQNAARGVKDCEVETRYYAKVLNNVIGGQIDYLYKKMDGTYVLVDWKITSVWSSIFGGKVEWEQQLNLLAYLLLRNDKVVTDLKIMAIYRDWSKSKTNDSSYPQIQGEYISIPLWSIEEQREYLEKRVQLFIDAAQGCPIDCTDDERWKKPDVYALMKDGRKSALKLCDSEAACYEYAQGKGIEIGKSLHIQHRPGVYTRCDGYCNVSEFCDQYQNAKD